MHNANAYCIFHVTQFLAAGVKRKDYNIFYLGRQAPLNGAEFCACMVIDY